jgi:hypothetical protein
VLVSTRRLPLAERTEARWTQPVVASGCGSRQLSSSDARFEVNGRCTTHGSDLLSLSDWLPPTSRCRRGMPR